MNEYIRRNSYVDKYKNEFEEKRLIGYGSYGQVFEVISRLDQSRHAVKKIFYKNIADQECEEGIKELGILAKITSDYVVQYRKSWVEDRTIYIQMEYCFENLSQFIKTKTNLFRSVGYEMALTDYFISCETLEEITRSLNFLHTLNPPIIHRDLKPENILISDGINESKHFIKICDFGYAKSQEYSGQSNTQDKGNVCYMAPEVVTSRQYDVKSDIYSLGLIGQELFGINVLMTENNWNQVIESKNVQLRPLYKALEQPILEMLATPGWRRRPSCEEILSQINNWRLGRNEIKKIRDNLNALALGDLTLAQSAEDNLKTFFRNFLTTKIDLRLNSQINETDNRVAVDMTDGLVFPIDNNNIPYVRADRLRAKEGDIIEIKEVESECNTIWAIYVCADNTIVYVKPKKDKNCELLKNKLEVMDKNSVCRVNNLDEAAHRRGLKVQNTGAIIMNTLRLHDKHRKIDLIDAKHNLRIHFVTKCRYGKGFCEKFEGLEMENTIFE